MDSQWIEGKKMEKITEHSSVHNMVTSVIYFPEISKKKLYFSNNKHAIAINMLILIK